MIVSETCWGRFTGVRSLEITQTELDIWNESFQNSYNNAPIITFNNIKELLDSTELEVNDNGYEVCFCDILRDTIQDTLCSQKMEFVDYDIDDGDGMEIE